MNLPVILTDDALSDLQEAHDWYNKQKPGLGVVFTQRAKTKLGTLGMSPEMYGKVWNNIRATTIHKYPYVVYYRILSDCVEVVAILHGSRLHRSGKIVFKTPPNPLTVKIPQRVFPESGACTLSAA